jgi:hypothetical protein
VRREALGTILEVVAEYPQGWLLRPIDVQGQKQAAWRTDPEQAGSSAEVESLTSDLIELSTRQNFASWSPGAKVLRGWARSVCGNKAEGILWIEDGIEDYRAAGWMLAVPYWLGLKAEASDGCMLPLR